MNAADHNFGDLTQEVLGLLDQVYAGEASPDELSRLRAYLDNNEPLQRVALAYLDLHAMLQRRWRGVGVVGSADSTNAVYGWVMAEEERRVLAEAAARESQQRPICPVPPPTEPRSDLSVLYRRARFLVRRYWKPVPTFMQRVNSWMLPSAALCCLLLVAFLLLMPVPPIPPLAHYLDGSNVRWANADLAKGAALKEGRYALETGVVRLKFADGAEVHLEAPCEFRLIAEDAFALQRGTAFVDLIHGDGTFVVETPTAKVTDLGTSFGVAVDREGSTEAMVMEGKVVLTATASDESVIMPAANRSGVSATTGKLEPVRKVVHEHEYARFPQATRARVWLANLICEPESGELDDCDCSVNIASGERYVGDQRPRSQRRPFSPGSYVSTPHIAAIDGVFVPVAGDNCVVDSAGHTFDQFRDAQVLFGDLWVGRPFAYVRSASPRQVAANEQDMDARRISRHAIGIHVPKGFTIDLEQVSNANNGLPVKRFRTGLYNAVGVDDVFDVWILVDGQPVYSRTNLAAQDGVIMIDLPLPTNARYMTLAATGGPEIDRAWAVLDKAHLVLGQ